jgi:hypothetical protein
MSPLPERSTSESGQTATCPPDWATSALPPTPGRWRAARLPKSGCQPSKPAVRQAAFSRTPFQSIRRARSGAAAMMVSICSASRVRWTIRASAITPYRRAIKSPIDAPGGSPALGALRPAARACRPRCRSSFQSFDRMRRGLGFPWRVEIVTGGAFLMKPWWSPLYPGFGITAPHLSYADGGILLNQKRLCDDKAR